MVALVGLPGGDLGARPPQDVDVLAVLDFPIPCFCPETPGYYKDGNEGLKDPGRRGLRRPEEPFSL